MYAILTSGNVLAAQCRCIAGKREAYNLVAALLFYIQDIKRIEVKNLPLDNTVMDHQQQWHVPPKRSVAPQPLSKWNFTKQLMGRKCTQSTCCTSGTPTKSSIDLIETCGESESCLSWEWLNPLSDTSRQARRGQW